MLKKISLALVIIGALNWGLVGIGMLLGSNWNVVDLITVNVDVIEAIIYILVGLGALVMLFGGKGSGAPKMSEPKQEMPQQPGM